MRKSIRTRIKRRPSNNIDIREFNVKNIAANPFHTRILICHGILLFHI